jgi:hypothetical protein
MKASSKMPKKVRDVDFNKLRMSHLVVLADWMGIMRQVRAMKGKGPRAEFVKQACLDNEARAQEGYEIIVLGATPVGGGTAAVPQDQEKRMFEVLTNVIDEHKDQIETKAGEAVDRVAQGITKKLEAHAKEALRVAAEGRAPIIIKEAGKVRKVSGTLQPEFKRICELASARIPIMLVGPAGCGKTYLGEKVAEALGLDFGDISCSEGMSESVFAGKLLPVGAGGKFEHIASTFMTRYEEGGVMLLDEIDASDANLLTSMNKAIANDCYTADQRYKKPVVKKHKDFVIMAAANTYGSGADAMYVGRNQLDAATLDRFKVGLITMDYSRDVEASLANDDLCQWAWTIRDKIRAARLKRVMSTRVIKDLATMTKMYGWTVEKWQEAYFTGWTDAEKKLVA